MKCKVCGKHLALRSDRRYEVAELTDEDHLKVYECFDCEYCGCQNLMNIREVGICRYTKPKFDTDKFLEGFFKED